MLQKDTFRYRIKKSWFFLENQEPNRNHHAEIFHPDGGTRVLLNSLLPPPQCVPFGNHVHQNTRHKMAGVVFEDIFDVKDIDPGGKKFDRGRSLYLFIFIMYNLL